MSIKNFLHNGKYSQQGEQGIIDEALKRMKITKGFTYEFGAPTKSYCSNTYHLIEKGFNCVFLDSNPEEIGIIHAFITPENVNIYIPNCDVLSIDCDGNDYAIWEAYNGKPDIVIIEINSSLDPNVDYFTPEKGANYSIMKKLAESKGYFVLVHTGNLVCVLNKHAELFPDKNETFDTSWLKEN